MKHCNKYIKSLSSLVVDFWVDATSPLVKIRSHNHWIITQCQYLKSTKQVSDDKNYPVSVCIQYFHTEWKISGANRLNN